MTMTDDGARAKAIDKAKKLFALGTSPNENEAAAAVAKAQSIMFAYNLSLEDLVERHVSEIGERITDINSLVTWQSRLANAVAYSSLCELYVISKSRVINGRYTAKRDRTIVFVGRDYDTEMAELIMMWLMGELNRLSNQYADSLKDTEVELSEEDIDDWYLHHGIDWKYSTDPEKRAIYEAGPPATRLMTPADRKVARRSWLEGAATSVARRLTDEFDGLRYATEASKALVVHRTADIEEFMGRKDLVKGKKSYSARKQNTAAWLRGMADGTKVSLRPDRR